MIELGNKVKVISNDRNNAIGIVEKIKPSKYSSEWDVCQVWFNYPISEREGTRTGDIYFRYELQEI